jgi:hypothetical protein
MDRIVEGLGAAREAMVRVRLPRIFGLVMRNPRDSLCALIGTGAIMAIVANSLYLQSGPHPAPIFAIRPPPVVARESTGGITQPHPALAEAQKSATQKTATPKIDPVPLPRPRVQPASAHADPIADLINPARQQLSNLQRALNDFGYGPVKVSGTFDDNTRESIERFERDHSLPVTGQNSPRLRRAFSAATGRTLD